MRGKDSFRYVNWKRAGIILMLFAVILLAETAILQRVYQKENAAVETSGGENWGLGFGEANQPPSAPATVEDLKALDTYYIGDTNQKTIYLTFDAGYENGNTPAILDALKKHNAPACFFVVGNYLNTAPDLVKRMVEEGHTVGNHTYSHPDMSKISDLTSFTAEMTKVEDMFKEITGEDMVKFYRPPQGKYSIENLKMAQQLGYKTFFWSLAYVDWYQDKQPSHAEAFEKLNSRIHNGAIVLLHSTSKTNGEILDELLTDWESQGYQFGSLKDLVGMTEPESTDNSSDFPLQLP